LTPDVVVSDGSNLYPAVLAELWPDADHQLCVFHVIRTSTSWSSTPCGVTDAMSRRGKAGGKEAGRKGAKAKARAARRDLRSRRRRTSCSKHRHLIVKRRENLTEPERDDLTRMLEYLPGLATLRRFCGPDLLAVRHAQGRPAGGCAVPRSCATEIPGRARVGQGDGAIRRGEVRQAGGLPEEPGQPAVRTNNHVERTNRMFRFFETVRYKWRRRRTLVRFVV